MFTSLARSNRTAALVIIFLFFAVSVIHLDRFPAIFADEPWILSPGYKLFTRGIYGSDLFTGFHRMENHYLQFMPLLPILQGGLVQLIGVGVFQVRFLPVCIGTLVLALAFAVGTRLAGPVAGALATLLLVAWQWIPEGSYANAVSGVPLVDLSRIARYDVLVALFTLAALWFFSRAQHSKRLVDNFSCGVCIGAAGLSHIYGLLWYPALLLALLAYRGNSHCRPIALRAALLSLGTLIVIFPWVVVIAFNFDDYAGQMRVNASRLDVFNSSFYLHNLLTEYSRYVAGVRSGAALVRFGFWLLVIGVPVAWVHLVIWSIRKRQSRLLPFLVVCLVVPLLFALLLQPKTFRYLPGIVCLFALLMATALTRTMQAQSRWLRFGAAALILVTSAYGLNGIVALQSRARQVEPARRFLAQLREVVPASARVLALPDYWIGLSDNEYRVFYLLFYFSMSVTADTPIALDEALDQIAPHVILLDVPMQRLFADHSTPESSARSRQFWEYMNLHHSKHIRTVLDNHGSPIEVYQLSQAHQ